MPYKQMVDFNPEENLRNLSDEDKALIKDAVSKTYSKIFPNGKSLDYIYSQFKQLIEPNFEVKCGKCRTRVINFFHQRSKNW
jgi:hypothetical protein